MHCFHIATWCTGSATTNSLIWHHVTERKARPVPSGRKIPTPAASPRQLTLLNRFLADRDRLAPPALVARQSDVLPRDLGRIGVALIAYREEHVLARGEMGGVLFPRRPLLGRRAAGRREKHCQSKQELPSSASHRQPPERLDAFILYTPVQ